MTSCRNAPITLQLVSRSSSGLLQRKALYVRSTQGHSPGLDAKGAYSGRAGAPPYTGDADPEATLALQRSWQQVSVQNRIVFV